MTKEELKVKIKNIPRKPGVYRFYNDFGKIIYIGKGIDLRRRVAQYFGKAISKAEEKTQLMAGSISDLDWTVVNTELEALLMEDELIKEHWPEYNIKQKQFLRYKYVIITDDEYPTLKIVDRQNKDKYDEIYGPFSDEFYIKTLFKFVNKYYFIRCCSESNPQNRCSNYSFGYCKAPCSGDISKDEYDKIVQSVRVFFDGVDGGLLQRLREQMDTYSNRLEFEKANKALHEYNFAKSFLERQIFVNNFKTRPLLVQQFGGRENSFLFVRGDLIKTWASIASEGVCNKFYQSKISSNDKIVLDDYVILDRAILLLDWIRSKRIQSRCIFFDFVGISS